MHVIDLVEAVILFPNWIISLHSHQQNMRVPFSPTFLPAFNIFMPFIFHQLDRWKGHLTVVLMYGFLINRFNMSERELFLSI